MDAIYWIAEQKIKEAIAAGEFENLPGKGKPIHFDREFSGNNRENMAFKILKNAGFVPLPIRARKELQTLQETIFVLFKECRERKSELLRDLKTNGIYVDDFSVLRETNSRQKFIMNRNLRESLFRYNSDVLESKRKYHSILKTINIRIQKLHFNCIKYEIQPGKNLTSLFGMNFVNIPAELAEFDVEFQIF